MRIDHLAIWVEDIDKMRNFYLTYFSVTSGEKYYNPLKKYTSYFLTFTDGGSRIELMHRPDIENFTGKRGFNKGLGHFSISVGGREKVNNITERFRKDGYTIASEPRITGDGYYESAVLDPEGNYIEIFE